VKKNIIFLSVFLLISFILFSAFSVKQYVKKCEMVINKISPERALKMYNSGNYIFLDVREANEIKKRGTIPHAICIPRGLLEFRISSITRNDFNKRMIVFSNDDARSTLATFTLYKTLGYAKVYRLNDGYIKWKNLGYPTTLTLKTKKQKVAPLRKERKLYERKID